MKGMVSLLLLSSFNAALPLLVHLLCVASSRFLFWFPPIQRLYPLLLSDVVEIPIATFAPCIVSAF